jgi:hypothetical protein
MKNKCLIACSFQGYAVDDLRVYPYKQKKKNSANHDLSKHSHMTRILDRHRLNSGFGLAAQSQQSSKSMSPMALLTFFPWLQIIAAASHIIT